MNEIVARFERTWNEVDAANTASLAALYHEDCVFSDPVHEVRGLAALEDYCRNLYENVSHCRFRFEEAVASSDRAAIPWTMELRMTSFRKGELIELPGISHIEFDDKIRRHRDFFDLGDLVYEHIPLLGVVVRAVKRRLA